MVQSIIQGYTALDNCYKYTDSDSTIDCYVFSRQALQNPIRTIDAELKTNSIYLLVGKEDDVTKVYVGQAAIGADGESVIRRMKQHLGKVEEKYFPYWTQAIIFVCRNTEPSGMWKTSDIDDLEALLITDTIKGHSWNGKNETVKNEVSVVTARSHSRKLFDIKEYIKGLGFNFFDDNDEHKTSDSLSYEDRLAAEEKKIIDRTVSLKTINLEPYAEVPEYTTPEKVVNDMLDLLPWETFNHDTKFFDPACKGGEFLALIHDRLSLILMNDTYFDKYTGLEKNIRIHDHIIKNQLYGIAIGDNSYKIAKERVYDCENIIKAGSTYIKILKQFRKLNKVKSHETVNFEHELIRREFNKDMKFDIIIGNPPYQGADGKSSIYPEFVEHAIDLSDITCMITRDNWLTGMAFEDMRSHLTNKGSITEIYHYPLVGEIFKTVGVAVAYFIWKKNINEKALYTRIENGEIISSRRVDVNNIILSDIASNIIDKVHVEKDWASYFNSRSYPFMDQRKRYALDDSEKYDDYYNVAVLVNKERPVFTNIGNFQNIDEVRKYKVLCGVVINEALPSKAGNVLTNIKAIGPMQVASETWSLVATFDTEEETVNCKKYVQSKFFRFLANQTVNNRSNVTKNTFKYIPLQDFTLSSDIDWSQPINIIDQQLYKKYNLTQEEIEYIEATIKSTEPKYTIQDALANYVHKQINS